MSRLSVAPVARDDAKQNTFMQEYARRIEATPPGMCPVALQLSLLQASGCQTCGKCTPCREGIPQLEGMLEAVLALEGTPAMLDSMRKKALTIRDTADCAIGWHAAEVFLQGMDTFAKEYESHVNDYRCQPGVSQTVPCETMCPAHVDVPAYIALVGEGNYAGAINMIRKDNPFPTACAFVCEHPCETRCRRTLIDAPINIRGIKKFAVDNLAADQVATPTAAEATGKKIAIIGGGPSGLTCAYFSALMGHEVHVFEGRKQLGGMMRYGIPAYRFPRERLDEDIRAILATGNITVHYESQVNTEEMSKIAADYDAVYVAIGAQGGKGLKMDGTDAEGVMSAVELLTQIGDGDYPDFTGKKVVVIGGGNVAMDCARTSVRAGAESVTVAYRRRIDDMTALRAEIDSAMQEGVEMLTLQAPDHIEVENGHCTALYTQPQMIGPVRGGRPAPQKADKPLERIEADIVLIAVGQDIVSAPFEEFGMQADRTYFEADEYLQSIGTAENVFVGGDCQIGPKTVILAIGAGKVAARNIDDFLGFDHELDCGVVAPAPKPNNRTACGRVQIVERPARERKNDFGAVEVEMSLEEAQQECGRCLRCDHYGCGVMDGGRIQYV
ncbi:MAG: NAD(P)-binding protein [Eggerthellaceae bacterium]